MMQKAESAAITRPAKLTQLTTVDLDVKCIITKRLPQVISHSIKLFHSIGITRSQTIKQIR